MKKGSRHILKIAIICLILVVLVFVGLWGISVYQEKQHEKKLEETRLQLQSDEVQGLFCAMFPLDTYDAGDFEFYKGIPTVMLEEPLRSGEELVNYVESVLLQHQYLQTIYIGLSKPMEELDLEVLKEREQAFIEPWEYDLQALISQFSEIEFKLILEYPSARTLSQYTESEIELLYEWYEFVADIFSVGMPHVKVYMPGAEMWALGNRANYLKNGAPNEAVAEFVLGQIICMDRFVLNSKNVDDKIEAIEEAIENDLELSNEKNEYTYVFFGDSVIGNFTDSMSIPGVVKGFTNGTVINCGYGGMAAAKRVGNNYGITDIVDAFLNGDYMLFAYSSESSAQTAMEGIMTFHDKHTKVNEEKLVFFLSLGLNDYMSGCPLEASSENDAYSFEGAIKIAVNKLKEAYPESKIVLMSPNYLGLFEGGTEEINGYTLKDFIKLLEKINFELDTLYIDVYEESGIIEENEEDFLSDHVHPNEYGRYDIGNLVYKYIKKWRLQ